MAIVFDGPVTPDALTVLRAQRADPAGPGAQPDPARPLLDRNTVDLAELTRTNRTARFRAFDARLHVSERDVGVTKQVKLPPLSTSLSWVSSSGCSWSSPAPAGNNGAIIDAIYDDATNLTREVQARMEQARGDVLTDGKFTLAGEGGLTMEADYGVPGGHIVTPGTLWSTTASATIIANDHDLGEHLRRDERLRARRA
jgi:hypothetical protein